MHSNAFHMPGKQLPRAIRPLLLMPINYETYKFAIYQLKYILSVFPLSHTKNSKDTSYYSP